MFFNDFSCLFIAKLRTSSLLFYMYDLQSFLSLSHILNCCSALLMCDDQSFCKIYYALVLECSFSFSYIYCLFGFFLFILFICFSFFYFLFVFPYFYFLLCYRYYNTCVLVHPRLMHRLLVIPIKFQLTSIHHSFNEFAIHSFQLRNNCLYYFLNHIGS
jgi:hypothetical protein